MGGRCSGSYNTVTKMSEGDKTMYDLYELKDKRWMVVDTFRDLVM